MFYIVGLGNPGDAYKNTRHNVGFMVLDTLVVDWQLPALVASGKYSGRVSEGVCGEYEVCVLYPDTFMNNSGSAVQKLVPKNEVGNLVVVYDDVDLPFGEIKISQGRGAGGHNGISSVIASMGTKEFVRLRVGVAKKSFWTGKARRPAAAALHKHVLGRFTGSEQKQLEDVKKTAVAAIETIVTKGVVEAMNQYN